MNRKLIDHLLKSGVTTSAKMQAALSAQRARGGDILDILVKRGVDEVGLARAVGAFHGLKVVDLGRVSAKPDALNRVNRNFCERYLVFPFAVDRSSGDLFVAVADPARASKGLKSLQSNTGQRLRIYVAPRMSLIDAIAHAYSQSHEYESVSREASQVSLLGGIESQSQSPFTGFGGQESSPGEMVSINNFFEDSSPGYPEGRSESFFGRESHSGHDYNSTPGERRFGVSSPGSRSGGPMHVAAENGELAALREENAELRRSLHRIEASLQLEINLLRELVDVLLDGGVIDRKTYIERMSKLR